MRLPNHRRWLRLMASVAAAVTAAATLSTAGCGQPHTPAIAPAPTDPWPTVEAALDGTTEDRAAVELLSEATFREAVAACMSRAGWSYQPDLADNGYQGWTEIPPATALPALRTAETMFRPVDTAYIERHGLDVHKRLALQFPQTQLDNPAYLKLDPSKRTPYERQLQACQPDLEAFTGDRLVPQLARDLKNALLATMREIAARPDVAELLDYPACINAKGYIEVSPLTDRPVANCHDLAAVIRHDYEPYTDGMRLNRPDTDPRRRRRPTTGTRRLPPKRLSRRHAAADRAPERIHRNPRRRLRGAAQPVGDPTPTRRPAPPAGPIPNATNQQPHRSNPGRR